MPDSDERGPKERAYDEEIAPLMKQIIATAKRAGIPMHASFALDGDLSCTTHIPVRPSDVPEDDEEAVAAFNRTYGPAARRVDEPQMFAITITHDDRRGL